MGKPVIHFGVTWYHDLPGIHEWKGAETIVKALSFVADKDKLSAAFNRLSRKAYTGLVDHGYSVIIHQYDPDDMVKKTAASIVSVLREPQINAATQHINGTAP
jgi:hypothetical protein